MISRRSMLLSTIAAAGLQSADENLVWSSLQETAALLRRARTSPVELTQLCLKRVSRLNPQLNAFVTITKESALERAAALEAEGRARRWRGPLHGIPIALKDLYDTAGVRTTAGSHHWADRVPSRDAEVVSRLRNAGAIILGKLNMDEFAYNYTGETSFFGTSRNPWNPQRTPGGSSGGSAVAVASGMCFAALGSDTGGSIRLPAAFCGITGFKPTYGIVSTEGVAPLAWSLDHVGPMCRSASDAAIVHEVLSGRNVRHESINVKSLRIGMPRASFYDGLSGEVANAIEVAGKELNRMTAGLRDIVLPALPRSSEIPELPQTYIRIITAEAHAFHEEMLRGQPNRYHPGTRRSIEGGASVTAAEYIRAHQEMERLRAEGGRLFTAVDLLLTPTAPAPAFEFGSGSLVFLRNTAPWNLLGLPSISVPCGFSVDGLPIGLQITGAAGRDDQVFALAAAWQQATDWHTRRPPVG